MPGLKPDKTRLETWKEIGAFFGKTERTVKRWERDRALPVHRLPGAGRSRIYADTAELEAWFRNTDLNDEVAEPDAATTVPRKANWPWQRIAAGIALAVVVGGGALVLRVGLHAPHRPPAAAQALYLKGVDDWNQRTPQTLNRAVSEFNAAIRLDPDYAQAYAGLADCYNLMREYTGMPSSQAYPLAIAAPRHALKLDDRLADAHAALAFALFYGDWNAGDADREYQTALRLEPGNANIQHWYATFLMTRGDFAGALDHIDQAMARDSSSSTIKADRAMVLFLRGDAAGATGVLKALETADPRFRSPHSYLAFIYGLTGKDEDFVRETRQSAALAGDLYGRARAEAAESGLRSGGHKGMLSAMLKVQLDQFSDGTGSAFSVATTYSQLGDTAHAIDWLRLSISRHEADAIAARVDLRLSALMALPEYREQMAAMGTFIPAK